MNGNIFRHYLIPFVLLASLAVSHCAPFDESKIELASDAPTIVTDSGSDPIEGMGWSSDDFASEMTNCSLGYRLQEFPLVKLTEEELKNIQPFAPLNTDKYPLTTPGIGNDHAGLKHTPYSYNKQIAYSVDLSKYTPPTSRETVLSLKLFVPKMRKIGKRKNEFICFLETGTCSGDMKRKVKRHLNPDWQKEYKDKLYSEYYFNDVGTWKPISLGKGSLVYDKMNFVSYFHLNKKINILDPSALSSKKLTLIIGTQSYFDPELGAKLMMVSSFCRM
ncbi:MAG: hypothetical protein KA715_14670 [Xanthomonadaceae bacterium]|nr:hypothetical protein [Xanthomonadaceae bacterium]